MLSKKLWYSNPSKKSLVCDRTYKLLMTLKKLGINFDFPLKQVLQPLSLDGVMLNKFQSVYIRCDK